MNASSPTQRTKRCGRKAVTSNTNRKSRVQYHFTKEELEPYFNISQREAARRLKIAVITLKRICKREKFNWPYRASKSRLAQERNKRLAAQKKRLAEDSMVNSSTDESDSDRTADDCLEDNEDVRRALHSLALCAFQIERTMPTPAMSDAAVAFSRLPYMCMAEN